VRRPARPVMPSSRGRRSPVPRSSSARPRSRARVRLGYAALAAPRPGLVAERFADEGSLLAANAPILSVIGVDPAIVRVTLTERLSGSIAAGRRPNWRSTPTRGRSSRASRPRCPRPQGGQPHRRDGGGSGQSLAAAQAGDVRPGQDHPERAADVQLVPPPRWSPATGIRGFSSSTPGDHGRLGSVTAASPRRS